SSTRRPAACTRWHDPVTSPAAPNDSTRMAAHHPGKSVQHSEAPPAERPWRCFLAWLPPDAVLDALCAYSERLALALPSARLRWLPRRSLHLTLRFLGDCDAPARARIAGLLAGLPALPPIPARVSDVGY